MPNTLSAVTHYHGTVGNMWDSLYNKHQMRDSDIPLDRVYTMLSEVLVEVKLSEEQDKIAKIATGSNGAQVKPTAHDEYVNASKGKMQKGKSKGSDGKGTPKNLRQPYTDCWKPDGCSLGRNCRKYHLRRQLEGVPFAALTRTTPHSASAQLSPSPRTSSMMRTRLGMHRRALGRISGKITPWTMRSMRQRKVRKAKVRDPSRQASPKERKHRGPFFPKMDDQRDLFPSPRRQR